MENKIKLNKALVVNREEITRLQESQMSKIKGGYGTAGGQGQGPSKGEPSTATSGCSCLDLSCNRP